MSIAVMGRIGNGDGVVGTGTAVQSLRRTAVLMRLLCDVRAKRNVQHLQIKCHLRRPKNVRKTKIRVHTARSGSARQACNNARRENDVESQREARPFPLLRR